MKAPAGPGNSGSAVSLGEPEPELEPRLEEQIKAIEELYGIQDEDEEPAALKQSATPKWKIMNPEDQGAWPASNGWGTPQEQREAEHKSSLRCEERKKTRRRKRRKKPKRIKKKKSKSKKR